MADRKEVELLIRAREINTQAFDATAKKVANLSALLKEQTDAAERGEVSFNDLSATMKKLEQAGGALIKQQSIVDLYQKISAQLGEAQQKADAARTAQAKYATELEGVASKTRAQERQLSSFAKASDGAQKRVAALSASLANQGERLEQLGISSGDLNHYQEQIVQRAKEVGSAISQLGGILETYDAKLVSTKQAAAALAEDAAFTKQLQGAKQLREASSYVDFWTRTLNEAEVKERELNEVAAFEQQIQAARKLQQAGEYVNFWTRALNESDAAQRKAGELSTFRQLGVDAETGAANLKSFAATATATKSASAGLGASIREILDPTAAARSSLAGLESEVTRLAAEIGEGKRPIREYQQALNDLGNTQSSIAKLAGAIDGFREQEAVVKAAATQFGAARDRVRELAAQVRNATEPNEALAASLAAAEQALEGSNRELTAQQQKLARLAEPLSKAGVDVGKLADAEDRLRTVATKTSGAVGVLGKAMQGQNSATGKFLGLRPYELTNLGYQLNDVFTQIASGTSVVQTFAQQGGQIAQLFAGRLIPALAAVFPEVAILIVVFGTLFAAVKRVADQDARMREFAKALGASADGAVYNAKALADEVKALEQVGVKAADATDALKIFMHDGIDPAALDAFARSAKAAADITGEKLPDAAKKVADAFTGGYDAVKKLDEEFDFLTAAESKQIRAMFESGNVAGARTKAFELFAARVGAASDNARGPWSNAWRNLKAALGDFLDTAADSGVVKGLIADWKEAAHEVEYYTSLLPGAHGPIKSSSGGSAATGNAATYFKSDLDAVVKTAILEARRGDLAGQLAVAGVIANRMQQTGFSGTQVVTAKNQFEPLNNAKGIERLASIDENSKEYLTALNAIRQLLAGQIRNPIGNATNFYSPTAQAAMAARDGRSTTPGVGALSFAKPQNYAGTVSGNNFYSGSFPHVAGHSLNDSGDKASAVAMKALTAATQAQAKADQDYLTDQQRHLAAALKINDATRVQNAGLDAQADALEHHLSPAAVKQARINAEAAEQQKVDLERRQEGLQLSSQLSSSLSRVASQSDDLSTRWAAITQQTRVQLGQLELLRQKGFKALDDGTTLDQVKAIIESQDQILKQQAFMKVSEDQLADIAKRRAADIADVQRQYQDGSKNVDETAQAIKAIDALYIPKMQNLADKAAEFASSLDQAHLDPAIVASISNMTAALNEAKMGGIKTALADYETAVSSLTQKRDEAISQIGDQIGDQSISSVEAVKQADKVVEDLNGKIATMAANAADFAQDFAGAHPSPEMEKFIDKMNTTAANASRGPALNDPASKLANTAVSAEDTQLNQLIAQRNELVSTYNALVEQGAMTSAEAQQRSAAAYQQTQPLIEAQAAKLRELIELLHQQGRITDEAYNSWIAKLQLVNVQSQYVSENFKKIKDSLEQNFVSDGVEAFNSMSEAVAGLIRHTQNLGDTLNAIGNAALNFAAQFLLQLADMLVQMALIQAIQSTGLFKGVASGLAGLFDAAPMIAGATAVAGASATLAAAGGEVSASGFALLAGAGALAVTAAQLQAAANTLLVANTVGLFHGGGVVGGSGGKMRRPGVSPAIFAGAPRYHRGTAGVGLKSNEQAAILKRGEEVLTEDNPRHIKNQRGGKAGSNAGALALKVLNYFDAADMLEAALSTKKGEKVIMNHVNRNARAYRTTIGSTK